VIFQDPLPASRFHHSVAFQPDNTAIQRPPATSRQLLRLLALSRVVLDNFGQFQASWGHHGDRRVAQLALFFGANDFGSTMIEENVVAAAGGVIFRLSLLKSKE